MTHNWVKLAVAGALLAGSTASFADLSGSVAVTSDYIFDGISQTDNSPALQIGVDYGTESGFYFGAWASNVDFGGEISLETDLYAGFTFGNDVLSWDLGVVQYIYTDNFSSPPSGEDSDYNELYVGMTLVDNLTLKYWYADDYASSGVNGQRIKATYEVAINDTWSVPLEYTYTEIDSEDFNHVRVGIAANFEPLTVDVSYHYTDIDVGVGEDPDLVAADGLIVATVTFSF